MCVFNVFLVSHSLSHGCHLFTFWFISKIIALQEILLNREYFPLFLNHLLSQFSHKCRCKQNNFVSYGRLFFLLLCLSVCIFVCLILFISVCLFPNLSITSFLWTIWTCFLLKAEKWTKVSGLSPINVSGIFLLFLRLILEVYSIFSTRLSFCLCNKGRVYRVYTAPQERFVPRYIILE